MYRIHLGRISGWLAGAVGILALLLSSVGPAAADEGDMPGPRIYINPNPPAGSTPNCVAVKWDPPVAIGEDIDGYRVNGKDVAENLSYFACGLDPNTSTDFQVCAVYISEEEDEVTGCSSAPLSTTKAGIGEMAPSGPLPTPKVDEPLQKTPKDFGVGWKGFYDYDFYYLNVLPKGGKWNSIKHDDDGDWGWQRVDVTPGTTYNFRVKGCVTGIFGDPCSGWSPEATVTIEGAYGPDTCASGFVWRDGVPGDHICVTPERRQKVADDLSTGRTRMANSDPTASVLTGACSPVLKSQGQPLPAECWKAPECLDGFVSRGIPGENALVCVEPKEADLIKHENANPRANMVQP